MSRISALWHVEKIVPPGSADAMLVIKGDERDIPIATLDPDDEEAESNARLIAAAPRLLAAADAMMANLADAGQVGPDDPDCPHCDDWPRDEDGNLWYPDAWELQQAILQALGEPCEA